MKPYQLAAATGLVAATLGLGGCTRQQALALGLPVFGSDCNGPFISQQACPQQYQAREEAQAAQQAKDRQAMIAKLGGIAQYQAYEEAQAIRQRAETVRTMYAACLDRLPIPATEYMDKWEQSNCAAYANQFGNWP